MTPTLPLRPTGQVLQVCTSAVRDLALGDRSVASGMPKNAVEGRVDVGPLGLAGDAQADPGVHGGLHKAVYAYPSEHLPFWQTVRAQARAAAWGAPIAPGLFGENLLLQGVRETELFVGDRLVLPHCVLAVSEPRFPCFKFNAAMGFAQAAQMMTQSGFCGSYLMVIEAGSVQAGEPFALVPGPRDVNIAELFRSRLGA